MIQHPDDTTPTQKPAIPTDATHDARNNPTRDLPAIAKRVLIIGLDGATWDILNPMMDSGRMPNLKTLLDRGVSGPLESTKPPITPAAWTTFMTGKNPGSHGIFDFERYDVHTNELSFNSTQSISRIRTIWKMLSDKGLKVGAVNVPMTYPPQPVNGFVITGFETPGVTTEFTYPPDLKSDILNRWPDYTFKTTWRRKTLGGDKIFAENLADISNSFHQGAEVTQYCGDRYGWDALMVVYKLVDNLQHKTWKYLDPKFNKGHERRFEMAADCFRELDIALGKLFTYAENNEAYIYIMSDHGHGSLEGKAQANLLLKDWGYLVLKPGSAQSQTRLLHVLKKSVSRKKGKFATHQQIDKDLAIDFSKTRACVMHAGIYGFLYLNLKGRQPDGIVTPGEYEALRDELRDRLLAYKARRPDGTEFNLFPEIHRPEELYNCTRANSEWMPDLLLAPAEGLSVVRKIRGNKPVVWLPWRKLEGTHRLDGVYAVSSPGTQASTTIQSRDTRSRLVDTTPTILAMMGLRVPDDMDGRVASELFDPPLNYESEPAMEGGGLSDGLGVYSEADEKLLTERLADLGYLE